MFNVKTSNINTIATYGDEADALTHARELSKQNAGVNVIVQREGAARYCAMYRSGKLWA